MSKRMLFELKRHNYVTPTNYLELVTGYKRLAQITNSYYRIAVLLFAIVFVFMQSFQSFSKALAKA